MKAFPETNCHLLSLIVPLATFENGLSKLKLLSFPGFDDDGPQPIKDRKAMKTTPDIFTRLATDDYVDNSSRNRNSDSAADDS